MKHETSSLSKAIVLSRRGMLAAISSAWLPALAAWPDRTVQVVVPWPASGVVDVPTRLVFNQVQAATGHAFIIENKLGAGGAIGGAFVAKASHDGNTLCVTTSAVCINQALGINQQFDPIKDFDPIAMLGSAPTILVVTPDKGIKTVADLVKLARSKPGRLTFASAGNGSPAHLQGEWMKTFFGIDVVHVPYKGAPAAMLDQIAGLVDFQFANATVALPQIKAGKVIPIAVSSPRPLPYLPNVPTMQSAGVSGFDGDQWIGVLGPVGMPRDVVAKLAADVDDALRVPSVREGMAQNGVVAADPGGTPQAFRQFIVADLARWSKVVKTANIKME